MQGEFAPKRAYFNQKTAFCLKKPLQKMPEGILPCGRGESGLNPTRREASWGSEVRSTSENLKLKGGRQVPPAV